MTEEIRAMDNETGGQKGVKGARFSLLPPAWWELCHRRPARPEDLLSAWWNREAPEDNILDAGAIALWEYLGPEGPYAVAKVYGWGAQKYSEWNWRRGYPWSWSYDAAMRHAAQARAGEVLDQESGLPHWAHFVWHCLALITFVREHPKKDDRYRVPLLSSR